MSIIKLEQDLLNIYELFIKSLHSIRAIVASVEKEFDPIKLKLLITNYDELFNNPALDQHILYEISRVGKSSVAFSNQITLNETNSNLHLTLQIDSNELNILDSIYDNKFSDILKFYKHIFSCIEDFSISKELNKKIKYQKLIDEIVADFNFLVKLYELGDSLRIFNTELITAIKFLNSSNSKKNDWQLFLDLIIEQNINCLYHFTDRENLHSIKIHGLCSWFFLEQNNISIKKPGGNSLSREIDIEKNLENFVRLSFCEKHPMCYVAVKDKRIINPIILKYDPQIILLDSSIFSNHNAAKKGAEINNSLEFLRSFNFSVFTKDYLTLKNSNIELASHYQSEILVKKNIPNEYLLNKEVFY